MTIKTSNGSCFFSIKRGRNMHMYTFHRCDKENETPQIIYLTEKLVRSILGRRISPIFRPASTNYYLWFYT